MLRFSNDDMGGFDGGGKATSTREFSLNDVMTDVSGGSNLDVNDGDAVTYSGKFGSADPTGRPPPSGWPRQSVNVPGLVALHCRGQDQERLQPGEGACRSHPVLPQLQPDVAPPAFLPRQSMGGAGRYTAGCGSHGAHHGPTRQPLPGGGQANDGQRAAAAAGQVPCAFAASTP